MHKVAFSGTSGSGKTTLVQFAAQKMGLKHISGSAGDLKTEQDKMILHDEPYNYPGGGHAAVIRYSALNKDYGRLNQEMLMTRRMEMIFKNQDFITDRSPADNLVYAIMQVGYQENDAWVEKHAARALAAWEDLTHVIYIKAVQPNAIEKNDRRVDNKWFQKTIDAAFDYWVSNFFIPNAGDLGPKVLVIDYWDLEQRKENVLKFLRS